MDKLYDCAGNELLDGDLVMHRIRDRKPLKIVAPFAYGWVIRTGADQVLVSGVNFLDSRAAKRYVWGTVWGTGGRWMNPRNLRRMPPDYIGLLPQDLRRELYEIHRERVM